MTITIDAPLPEREEIEIRIAHRDAELLRRIKANCSQLDALRTLQFMDKRIGLMSAFEFCKAL